MPYLTDSDDETRIGDDVYSVLGGTAWNPWHDLQQRYDAGDCMFVFVGASNGCIPAAFFAKQYADKALSLTFLSCVPGREQWGDVARLHCPITVTCGSKEAFFGGASILYSFAQTVHASVFSFVGGHLHEGKDTLRRLASFVADASKPSAAAPASPRRSPRRKSKSPSATRKSPPPRRRAGQRGDSKTHQRKRSRSEDSRRAGAGKKSASPKRG